MKTRIIVAVIFVPLLFVILFFLPPVAATVLIAAIAGVAAYELLLAVGQGTVKRLCCYTAVSAVIIPVGVLFGPEDLIFRAVLFLLPAAVFSDAVLSYKTPHAITLSQAVAAVFGGALIPYFLSSIISLKLFEQGRFYVLIPFIIAFITDGGAYFTGVFFGKHHPFPNVSPKKTAEGCIGGIMTGVAAMVLYGVILHFAAGITVSFWALAVYGLVGGIATELGDLAFSLVKRAYNIKDYGRLIPGHGGILDRFDSMIFAAPVIHMLAVLWPAF